MNRRTLTRRMAVLAAASALQLVAPSCNLDRNPIYEPSTETVYGDFANYKSLLAKLYAGYAVSGQQGPAGQPDIQGIDEGFSQYLRQYWKAQELTTDEAVIAWNDGTLPTYHQMTWTSGNEFIRAMYNRIYYQISLCNEFVRQTSDDNLSKRGISGSNADEARRYRAEARFLRALSYWHALDLFGNVPFVTESDAVGATAPRRIERAELFNYIESELKALDASGDIAGARQNEYARADKGAVATLLAKLYLNARVYTGQPRYTDCITYCNKVIQGGYSLQSDYRKLFLADNNATSNSEFILPIAFDGVRTKGFGGMTFVVHAAVGGQMKPREQFGIPSGGWFGTRATKNLPLLFSPDPTQPDTTQRNPDKRFLFYTAGQTLEINAISNFSDGFAVKKFRNLTSTGAQGSDPDGTFVDTDFPLFRLADVYLMYAEAVLRGGSGGDPGTALGYVNQLRQRAFGNSNGNINAGQLNLQFILDERGRELYWEGHRRTDLIRFRSGGESGPSLFTSSAYVWPFKGNVPQGTGVDGYRDLFPIPSTDLQVNPNLIQNTGY